MPQKWQATHWRQKHVCNNTDNVAKLTIIAGMIPIASIKNIQNIQKTVKYRKKVLWRDITKISGFCGRGWYHPKSSTDAHLGSEVAIRANLVLGAPVLVIAGYKYVLIEMQPSAQKQFMAVLKSGYFIEQFIRHNLCRISL